MTIFVRFVLRTWKFIVSLNSFWNIYTDVGISLPYLYCPIFAVLFVFKFFFNGLDLNGKKRKKNTCEWVAFKNLLSDEKYGAMLMCIGKSRNCVYLRQSLGWHFSPNLSSFVYICTFYVSTCTLYIIHAEVWPSHKIWIS